MTGQMQMQNVVAEVNIDIIIDDAPEIGTMQDEQFQMLVQLKQMDVNGEIPFKAIIEAAPNLRGKAKMLEAIAEREQAPPDPAKLADVQTQLENRQADTAKKTASAQKDEADAARIAIETSHKEAAAIVNARHGGMTPQPFVPPTRPPLGPQPAAQTW
jgi:hypothetical protein